MLQGLQEVDTDPAAVPASQAVFRHRETCTLLRKLVTFIIQQSF